MRTDSLIALKIGQDTPKSLDAALRPLLERAATAIAEAVQSLEGEGPRAELTGRLEGFLTALETASDDERMTVATQACLDMCEQGPNMVIEPGHTLHSGLNRRSARAVYDEEMERVEREEVDG